MLLSLCVELSLDVLNFLDLSSFLRVRQLNRAHQAFIECKICDRAINRLAEEYTKKSPAVVAVITTRWRKALINSRSHPTLALSWAKRVWGRGDYAGHDECNQDFRITKVPGSCNMRRGEFDVTVAKRVGSGGYYDPRHFTRHGGANYGHNQLYRVVVEEEEEREQEVTMITGAIWSTTLGNKCAVVITNSEIHIYRTAVSAVFSDEEEEEEELLLEESRRRRRGEDDDMEEVGRRQGGGGADRGGSINNSNSHRRRVVVRESVIPLPPGNFVVNALRVIPPKGLCAVIRIVDKFGLFRIVVVTEAMEKTLQGDFLAWDPTFRFALFRVNDALTVLDGHRGFSIVYTDYVRFSPGNHSYMITHPTERDILFQVTCFRRGLRRIYGLNVRPRSLFGELEEAFSGV